VAARSAAPRRARGLTLFLCLSKAKCIGIEAHRMSIRSNAAADQVVNVEFVNAAVARRVSIRAALFGGRAHVGRVRGRLEMVVVAEGVFGRTSISSERKQFGRPSSNSRRLHTAPRSFSIEIEITPLPGAQALQMLDSDFEKASAAVAVAKRARFNVDAASRKRAMHGGMGMTDPVRHRLLHEVGRGCARNCSSTSPFHASIGADKGY